jgi:Ca-activated chloride channel family protein
MKTRCTLARALFGIRLFAITLFITALAFAQTDDVHITPRPASAPQMRARSSSFRVDVDLVLVPATVTDTGNHPVLGLQQRNFSLFEDGQQQPIRHFHAEDAPISIGILLDTSGSMKNKYELAREALSHFFANANRNDDYFVITFSNKPQLLANTTQSIESIEAQLSTVVPTGGTPLLDAIYLGLSKLRQARYEKRALLIISDGGDNESRYSTKEIRDIAQESDVLIYAMGVFPFSINLEDRAGKKLLSELSDASGGRAAFLNSAEKLPQIAASMSRELRSQYVLGYRPTNATHDGKLRRIKVTINPNPSQPPLQVYYRRQYLSAK